MFKHTLLKFFILYLTTLIAGCSGVQTFQSSLRAGDTAAVAAGWKKNFSRNDITVTITPSVGEQIVYQPNHPGVRAVVNMYPDPISSMVVSDAIDVDMTYGAQDYALGTNFFTNGDRDWWQTVVFVDLPNTLPAGISNIEIQNNNGDYVSSTVNVIAGAGEAEAFDIEVNGPLNPHQFKALERVPHYEISFTSNDVVPHAMEISMSHLPDMNNGGNGIVYVSNPRGDLKNILWNDDGFNLKVILTPARTLSLTEMKDFKFYISGGIGSLVVTNITAVDSNGIVLSGINTQVNSNN